MLQTTGAKPTRVHALGARLTDEIAPAMYNYGCLQVAFDDGSVGWYEAGWGPMMSETAFFIKDMIGPKGAVSIAMDGVEIGVFRRRQPYPNQRAAGASWSGGRRRQACRAR